MLSQRGWKSTSRQENRKITSSNGWNLPGQRSSSSSLSRTRGHRVLLERPPTPEDSNDTHRTPKRPRNLFASTSNGSSLSTLTTSAATITTTTTKKSIPPPTRILIEAEKLKLQMQKYMRCPKCKSEVTVTFPTSCIASGSRVECDNKLCSFLDVASPAVANVPIPLNHGSPLIRRMIDWQANVLYMLAFLSVGDGGTEAGRLLGLLGLPNSTTMGPQSFGIIEEYVGPVIQASANEIVYEMNLFKEIKGFYAGKRSDDGTLLFDLWKDNNLPQDQWPRLSASGDMGWQGRSSGNSYNSLSGDALLVGQHTRKPMAWCILGKACSFCQGWMRSYRGKHGEPIPQHDCRKSWDGSSGAMEPIAILEMTKLLYYSHRVIVDRIVTDDDSSIKSCLKWNNQDTITNKGLDEPPHIINDRGEKIVRPDRRKLPADVPEPTFVADPNHRKKTYASQLYQLEGYKKTNNFTMTKMDVLRLSTNFAYMVRSLPQKPPSEFETAGKAVVEHHFDCHDFCGDWCKRKTLTDEERKQSTKYYRCKEKDKKLYIELLRRTARFITQEALEQVGHGMDTLCNESFNNVVAWIAPKNKVYSKSDSLKNRVGFALGVNGFGVLEYYDHLFGQLGLTMTDPIRHYLKQISNIRDRRIAKTKTKEGKRKRVLTYQRKLLEKTVRAKREKAKREGLYQSGMGINAGYTEEEMAVAVRLFPGRRQQQQTAGATATAATRPQKRDMSKVKCKTCNGLGHALVTNSKCKYHKEYKEWKATKPPKGSKFIPQAVDNGEELESSNSEESDGNTTAANADSPEAQTLRDAEECDLMDSIPLDDDDDDGMEDFFDAFESLDDDSDKEN